MAIKRQRWTLGSIVVVPLGNGFHSYAQMLEEPEYAFFDSRTRTELPAETVVIQPVLFRLWVMNSAHRLGRWQKVCTVPVPQGLSEPVLRYNQDPIRPQDIRLTYDGCSGDLCTVADCDGLECAAVWDPEHVEDRLRDHYQGVPNSWAESLKPKLIPPNQAVNPSGGSGGF